MSPTRSASPPEPATDTALVLCAHGTRGLAGAVSEHAQALGREAEFGEVGACALYGEPTLETWLDRLDAPKARLVPFMMAEGYTLDALKKRVAEHPKGARVEIGRAVGAHPDLTEMIARKARQSCEGAGWDPARTALLLVGHGTKRHAASTRTAEAHACRLAGFGTFAQVATAYLDDDPPVADAIAGLSAPRVVAVGFFTDAGDHGQDDVPELLRATGVPYRYGGPVGPLAGMREVILAQARASHPGAAPSIVEEMEPQA
jgi:sirohydrochlorin cobaltochelatase